MTQNKDLLLEKIDLAKEFATLTKEQKEVIIEKSLKTPDKIQIEYYKKPVT